MAIKSVTVKDGQTLYDLSLQLYGDVSKVFELITLNPDTIPNVLTNNLQGKTIYYEETLNDTTNYFIKNGIIVASKYPEIITGSAFSNGFSNGFN